MGRAKAIYPENREINARATCNLIIQNLTKWGHWIWAKGKGGYGLFAHHMAWLKVAHRMDDSALDAICDRFVARDDSVSQTQQPSPAGDRACTLWLENFANFSSLPTICVRTHTLFSATELQNRADGSIVWKSEAIAHLDGYRSPPYHYHLVGLPTGGDREPPNWEDGGASEASGETSG